MNTKAHAFGILIAVIGVTGFFLFSQRSQYSQHDDASGTREITVTQVPSPQYQQNKRTYFATEIYDVPHDHQNTLTVSLEVTDSSVSAVSLEHKVSSNRSQHHVDAFDTVYKTGVIGKPISEADLVYVSGSTRTSDAFNRAIEKIQQQI
jgi:uncharacterized protein with FMN-binding domain